MKQQRGKKFFSLIVGCVSLILVGCGGFKNIEESSAELSSSAASFSLDSSTSLNEVAGLMPPEFKGRKIFEMVTAGGFRPDCFERPEHPGEQILCIKASGYRIFSNGQIVKFVQDQKGVETQYTAGQFSQDVLQSLLVRINSVYSRRVPVVDLNEDAPICMDAPRVSMNLFFEMASTQEVGSGQDTTMQEVFELGRIENCHRFGRAGDPEAILLMEKLLALAQQLDRQPKVENRVLIEKNIQYGFRPDPLSTPESVLVQVFEDGRIIKVETFIESARNLKTEMGTLAPDKLTEMKDLLRQFAGSKLALIDQEKDQPSCQDVPLARYSIVREESAGVTKESFFEFHNCHSFVDNRFQNQSADLVKILDAIR